MIEGLRTWWTEGHPLVSRWTHTADLSDLTWVGHAANAYYRWTRWVRWSWWSYVLARRAKSRYGRHDASYPRTVWCRLTGHRGIVYYNCAPDAIEPDYSCRGCGEEIG